jgi:hypothetical protein
MVNFVDDEQFLEQYQRAVEAGNEANATEPRAAAAHYGAANHLIVIRLRSSALFSFPQILPRG